jgi:AraC family transcriptional regulator
MYSRKTIEAEISDRFRVPAPTRLSPVGKSPPLAFSRLRAVMPVPQKSKPARPEDAYVVHVMLNERADVQLWLNGREQYVPPLQQGSLLVGHLESTPVAGFNSDIDFVRFYVSKTTLDELAQGADLPRPSGLRRPDHGVRDPLLYHLAAAVAPVIQYGDAGDQLVLDQVALAFYTQLLSVYGGAPMDPRPNQCNLAPWQERRAKEFIDANLDRGVTLLEIAETCGLSTSHFSRAFRNSTGRPPHRWLLERRVEAAKALLAADDTPLAQIAVACGFSDPSHFSRVFLKAVGEPPAAWRRGHRN